MNKKRILFTAILATLILSVVTLTSRTGLTAKTESQWH